MRDLNVMEKGLVLGVNCDGSNVMINKDWNVLMCVNNDGNPIWFPVGIIALSDRAWFPEYSSKIDPAGIDRVVCLGSLPYRSGFKFGVKQFVKPIDEFRTLSGDIQEEVLSNLLETHDSYQEDDREPEDPCYE